MSKFDVPLPAKTTTVMLDKWLGVIRRGESASIMSLKPWDRHYRVAQFFQECRRDLEKINIRIINLRALAIEDEQELIKYLQKYETQRTVFIIMDGEWLLTGTTNLLPIWEDYLVRTRPRVSVLAFFEINAESPIYQTDFAVNHPFKQNCSYSNLYLPPEMDHFIRHLCQQYKLAMSPNDRKAIVEQCGGHIWLVTQCVRLAHEKGKVDFTADGLLRRVKMIWDNLSEGEKQVLVSVVKGREKEAELEEDDRYLSRIGLIRRQGEKQTITIPILADLVRKLVEVKQAIKLGRQGEILAGEVDISRLFSIREKKLMHYFLIHPNTTVSREQVGDLLWPNDEDAYSDWALNQMIKRLRWHIKQSTGFDPIKTVKGQGFIWT